MALALNDRVQQTGTANTTVSFTLTGTVAGFQSFAVIGNGNTTYYAATDASGSWEVGLGTYSTTGPTLTRTTILASSNSGLAVTFSGAVNVFVTYPAEKSINYDADDVATIGQTLSYADTGIIGSFASTVAGYNQVIIQNKSAATNASANLNISNDVSTSTSGFAELGINSSNFTGTGSFNLPSASYLASASTDLTIGTYGAYNVHFVTNSSTTDAMTIYNNGGISLGAFSNPGIGNMAASKFVPGYTATTAAAGTTVLTADSNYYQNLVGTTTQTFQLPDATTLLVGTTFIFDNNSTGVLTIVDNASGSVDTLPSGAAGFVYLANNSTVAGTWNRHSFLPVSYDFNTTTANFGNATITSAVWNGTTIASGYGGTGLTTFTAANNALYSTSASALVAGTLPIQAGGTAATTFTANGVLYGSGTSPLGVTAAGTTGQVLIGNTGAAPSWGTVSSSLVSSFQTSLSGLTPSTATTGAVTLAGTLGTSSGGTNLTSFTSGGALYATSTSALTTGTLPATSGGTSFATYTTGDIIYASATNTLSKLPIGSSGQILSVSAGVPSWTTLSSAAVTSFQTSLSGLTPNTSTTGAITLAGTLGPTSGGTGLTTYTQGDLVYATATNTLGKLADVATGNALISGGVSADPSWGKIGLTTHVSGTLPVANGGTGQSTYTDGQLLIGNSTGNTLTKASLTAGTGISITPGSGSISIASTVTSGLTITNDTTTATALYPTFTSATSGSISGASVTSTKLTFVPSTGALTAPNIVASNGMLVNSATVSTNYSIPVGSNAIAVGPVTVASGAAVTIPSGSRWLVL